jgi:hypothetical protein
MKSAYEIAMERFGKSTPLPRLTAAQKQQLAELDSKYAAKIAEREIHLQQEIDRCGAAGDFEKVEQLRQQLAAERKNLLAEREEKKEKVRLGNA